MISRVYRTVRSVGPALLWVESCPLIIQLFLCWGGGLKGFSSLCAFRIYMGD